MPLQVERIIESLPADGAKIALQVTVAFDVPIEKPLDWKHLPADSADKLVIFRLHSCKKENKLL